MTTNKTASTSSGGKPRAVAPSPKLQFPSVRTRLQSGLASTNYDTEGIPFNAPAGDCVMDLQTFFGAEAISAITKSGQIIFHSIGDSGVGTEEQEAVAEALALDVNNQNHELGASFMVHLGDVMYGPNKGSHYLDRFYRMYDHYDRLIFAIPGNHDGEVYPSTDPSTLAAFLENFCAPLGSQPSEAKDYGMLMPNQPGPYWHLQAPFVDIVAMLACFFPRAVAAENSFASGLRGRFGLLNIQDYQNVEWRTTTFLVVGPNQKMQSLAKRMRRGFDFDVWEISFPFVLSKLVTTKISEEILSEEQFAQIARQRVVL